LECFYQQPDYQLKHKQIWFDSSRDFFVHYLSVHFFGKGDYLENYVYILFCLIRISFFFFFTFCAFWLYFGTVAVSLLCFENAVSFFNLNALWIFSHLQLARENGRWPPAVPRIPLSAFTTHSPTPPIGNSHYLPAPLPPPFQDSDSNCPIQKMPDRRRTKLSWPKVECQHHSHLFLQSDLQIDLFHAAFTWNWKGERDFGVCVCVCSFIKEVKFLWGVQISSTDLLVTYVLIPLSLHVLWFLVYMLGLADLFSTVLVSMLTEVALMFSVLYDWFCVRISL